MRAPFAGTRSNVELVEGMVLGTTSSDTTTTSSQRVAVIKSESNPIVNVSLSEIDVPNVKVGQKATVTFDSIPDKTFTGIVATVDRIGSTTNSVTGYGVNIKLDSTSDEILPNMAVSANIITESKTDVLLIPSSAISAQSGETVAKVLRNGVEVDVPVETGISSDTQTEIVSGLNEGEEVITGTVTTSTSTGQTGSVFGGFGGGAVRINR
jgi:macrolide-specific efflux system membrane fusion protein